MEELELLQDILPLPERGPVWKGQGVQAPVEIVAFERGVRPALRIVLPEKAATVLRLRAAPDLQMRIEELAGKSTEGQFTATEMAEYAAGYGHPEATPRRPSGYLVANR